MATLRPLPHEIEPMRANKPVEGTCPRGNQRRRGGNDAGVHGARREGETILMPFRQILVYGAGGFAREVKDVIDAMEAAGTSIRCVGFLDDAIENHGRTLNDVVIRGGQQDRRVRGRSGIPDRDWQSGGQEKDCQEDRRAWRPLRKRIPPHCGDKPVRGVW